MITDPALEGMYSTSGLGQASDGGNAFSCLTGIVSVVSVSLLHLSHFC